VRAGIEIFSQPWVPHFLSPAQNVARVEASTEMLRILHESEENHFEGMARGDQPWFQNAYPSSKTFARSPTDVIPTTRQAIGTKETMITVFSSRRKLIVLNILPNGNKFKQPYLVDDVFPI
jgi:hypothetical protein